jgi:ABC-type sugar transport system substrate-binding protein|tara:strand:+ start:70 stop:1062 length:993 start_codon:yes stop_codon:yes gene_type:complete
MSKSLISKIYKTICMLSVAGFISVGNLSAKKITIGWTSYPADIPVIADAIRGGRDEGKRLGVEVVFALGAGAAAQANNMDDLIARGVDVIAIDPEDSQAIGASVKKANAAGIPVVMWIGDNLGGGKTVSLVSSDEELGGYSIAKWGFNRLGGIGRVAFIQGAIAHQAGLNRENGFRRAMVKYPKIELVGYGEANWARDKANSIAADMITRDPNIEMIFAMSDAMAKGVLSAVKSSNTSQKITGYNGDCETLNSVWNDGILATLYQGWRDIGAQTIRTSLDVAKGKSVPKKIIMPTFVIDKPAMAAIVAGTYDGVTPGLEYDVKQAISGCK